ncbi:MAG: sulfatase-like hydrolase/transferase [Planctomycetaceae bacterium]|nr:sulfatase-like hydrolase/transferase [Planctomycetaceae bacterium]
MNAADCFWRRILSVCVATMLLVAAMAADAACGAETIAGRSLAEWSVQLDSPSPVVRRRAVLSLGAFGKIAVRELTKALAHEDAVVRYWAASELGDLRDDAQPALDALRKLHGERAIGDRIAAAYALCRVGQVEEGLPTLLEGLKNDTRGVWNSSADFLARIGPPAKGAIPTLEEEGKRGADHIADICNEALHRIRGVDQPVPSKTANATQGDAAGGKANKKVAKESVFSKAFLDEDVSRFAKSTAKNKQPNVLWISAEDISPSLGCYGDSYAVTPRLDQLASEGMRFTRCFTHAGVCAISRSGLITGMYPIAIGSQHMRSQIKLPLEVKAFPEYLRAAGYWCSNRSKTDYNFPPPKAAWDENSPQSRDWRGRAAGQPFFSVINLVTTHESQIRGKFAETLHDPAKAQLPPYIPDTPVTRRDWARYADLLTTLDQQVAAILDQLEADGLAQDTIVFFWGDHGQGLSRGKRWLYDSGTRTPLIIRWPGKLKPGSVNNDLVCFLDFAPTMLRLAGVDVPSHLHGRVLPPIENGITAVGSRPSAVGSRPSAVGREFVFGHRDRMDETYDLIRSARDTRFKYLRNYAPRRSYAQNITYMNQMPTMQEWRRLNAEGKLTGAAALHFRETKPVEELFDTEADPHEVVNLAERPEHAETLKRMRAALERWQEEVGDSGLIPEPLLVTPLKLAER